MSVDEVVDCADCVCVIDSIVKRIRWVKNPNGCKWHEKENVDVVDNEYKLFATVRGCCNGTMDVRYIPGIILTNITCLVDECTSCFLKLLSWVVGLNLILIYSFIYSFYYVQKGISLSMFLL